MIPKFEAEPGDYITTARKQKGKDIGLWSSNRRNARKAKINFDFLDKGANYQAIIYRDADNADWRKIQKYIQSRK